MSNNLGLDQVAENQANKEVTINTMAGQLDAALTERFQVDVSAGNVTVTNLQYRRNASLEIINATTAGRDVTLPAIKRTITILSASANTQNVNIKRGTTTIVVAPGQAIIVFSDGTANGLSTIFTSSVAVSKPYDIGTFCSGKPAVSERLLRFNYVRAVTLAASLSGSRVTARVAASAQADFDVKVNGSSIGTIRFAAAGTVATFVSFAGTSIAVNDILEIVAPASQDATLEDISFTIAGVL